MIDTVYQRNTTTHTPDSQGGSGGQGRGWLGCAGCSLGVAASGNCTKCQKKHCRNKVVKCHWREKQQH